MSGTTACPQQDAWPAGMAASPGRPWSIMARRLAAFRWQPWSRRRSGCQDARQAGGSSGAATSQALPHDLSAWSTALADGDPRAQAELRQLIDILVAGGLEQRIEEAVWRLARSPGSVSAPPAVDERRLPRLARRAGRLATILLSLVLFAYAAWLLGFILEIAG